MGGKAMGADPGSFGGTVLAGFVFLLLFFPERNKRPKPAFPWVANNKGLSSPPDPRRGLFARPPVGAGAVQLGGFRAVRGRAEDGHVPGGSPRGGAGKEGNEANWIRGNTT